MAKWKATTLITWREPQDFVHRRGIEDYRKIPWRLLILVSLLVTAAGWASSPTPLRCDTTESREALSKALFGGVLLLSSPVLARCFSGFIPKYVKITDMGIFSNRSTWILTKDIEGCVLRIEECDNRRTAVMDIVSIKGRKTTLAIAESTSLHQIEEALTKGGIRIERDSSARYY